MRPEIRAFVEIASATLPWEGPVYEFGSLQVPDQDEFSNLRQLFNAAEYVGADMRQGPGVDRVLDLHHLDLPDDAARTIILLETLEHVRKPWLAVQELHRVLHPQGIMLVSVPFRFPVHGYPDDYWRYTESGLRVLLESFEHVVVDPVGMPLYPSGFIAVVSNSPIPAESMAAYRAALEPQLHFWRVTAERISAVQLSAVEEAFGAIA